MTSIALTQRGEANRMSKWMIFADRLKKEVERQGLTYRELANKMRVTTTTLFRYAKGQRIPRANEILKVANALGVTCDYLVGLADEPLTTAAQPDSKSGYWMFKEGETAFWDVCSKCGAKTLHRTPHFKYCPYCGSRMEV